MRWLNSLSSRPRMLSSCAALLLYFFHSALMRRHPHLHMMCTHWWCTPLFHAPVHCASPRRSAPPASSPVAAIGKQARHLINEAYFSMDDVEAAAVAGDGAAAGAAWAVGAQYINAYLSLINRAITSKASISYGPLKGTC